MCEHERVVAPVRTSEAAAAYASTFLDSSRARPVPASSESEAFDADDREAGAELDQREEHGPPAAKPTALHHAQYQRRRSSC